MQTKTKYKILRPKYKVDINYTILVDFFNYVIKNRNMRNVENIEYYRDYMTAIEIYSKGINDAEIKNWEAHLIERIVRGEFKNED